jgi:hypothetical protein
MLDIGCGMGGVLCAGRDRGFEMTAIEPVAECRQIAIERSGCSILSTPIEEAALPGGGFDAADAVRRPTNHSPSG